MCNRFLFNRFFDNILKKYGYGLLSLMNTTSGNNRGYSEGVLGTIPTYLYGKPLLYQRNVDSVFGILQSYVESQALNIFSAATLNSAGVVTFSIGELSDPSVTETDKEIFKGNYQRFLDTYRSSFINEATEMVSTLVESKTLYRANGSTRVVCACSLRVGEGWARGGF